MRRWMLVTLAVVAAAALVSGCTTHKALVVPQNPMLEAQQDGVSLSLRFLDEAQLKRKILADENPFLTEYNRWSFERIVVFDLMAANTGLGGASRSGLRNAAWIWATRSYGLDPHSAQHLLGDRGQVQEVQPGQTDERREVRPAHPVEDPAGRSASRIPGLPGGFSGHRNGFRVHPGPRWLRGHPSGLRVPILAKAPRSLLPLL